MDTSTLSYTAVPNTLPTPTLASSNYTVLSTSSLSISFSPSTSFTSVSVIFPSDVSVSNTSCSPNRTEFTSCPLSSSNLTFSSFNSITGDTTLSWGNNVMPVSLKPTGKFQIFTYYYGWMVESYTGAALVLTMNQTAGFVAKTVDLSSGVNNALASMTVGFTIPSGSPVGTLYVYVPAPVTVNSGLACTLNGASSNCSRSGNNVLVSISNNTTLANTLVLTSVTTPPSL